MSQILNFNPTWLPTLLLFPEYNTREYRCVKGGTKVFYTVGFSQLLPWLLFQICAISVAITDIKSSKSQAFLLLGREHKQNIDDSDGKFEEYPDCLLLSSP